MTATGRRAAANGVLPAAELNLLAAAWADREGLFQVDPPRGISEKTKVALYNLRGGPPSSSLLVAAGISDEAVRAVFERVKAGAGSFADAAEAISPEATRGTRLLDASEIFGPLPPVKYLCPALDLAPGAPGLIAGYGFSGKTVSAQDLALAVATETLAWGLFKVRGGRVLHIDFEQGAYLTRMRYQRLARARGIDPRELEGHLALASLPGWYLDSDAADELQHLCDGFDLVIIDSFRAACPSTDENSSEARVPLDRLTRISEATGGVHLMLHHARKPTRDSQGGARMAVRGSGALFDACGSVLVFSAEKGAPPTVEHEKARISGRPHEGFRLFIEDVEIDGDPTAGLRVSASVATAPSQATPSDRFGELKGRVLALVRQEGTIAGGVNAIRARLGGRKDDLGAAVAELERAGSIQRGGTYQRPTLTASGTDLDSK